MTTSSYIRDKWKTLVLEDATIVALCPNSYTFPIVIASETEAARLRDANFKINYISLVVSRSQKLQICNQALQTFNVRIEHARALTPGEEQTDYQTLIQTIEALEDKAVSALSNNWNGTVDYWQAAQDPPSVEVVTIDGVQCIRTTVTHKGFKNVALS